MKVKILLMAMVVVSLLAIGCDEEDREYQVISIDEADMAQLMSNLAQYDDLSQLVATFDADLVIQDPTRLGIVTKIVVYGQAAARAIIYTDHGIVVMRSRNAYDNTIAEFTSLLDVGDIVLLPEEFESNDKVKSKDIFVLKKYFEFQLGMD